MTLKYSFLVSIFFYTIIILFYKLNSKQEEMVPIKIQKGSSGLISFAFTSLEEGLNQNQKTENTVNSEGAIAEEVSKIQNKISYPPQALEDGLESDCEWSIVVNAEQKASQIKTVRPCKYRIFEEEFYHVIQNWNFPLPENTILQIPVSFKIKKE